MNGLFSIRTRVVFLVSVILFAGLFPISVSAQSKKIARDSIDIRASVEFVQSKEGELHFLAEMSSDRKEKTTLFVRDREGELVFEDKLHGTRIRKIYRIPSDISEELVFEWVRPQRMLLKKFTINRKEITQVSVERLN